MAKVTGEGLRVGLDLSSLIPQPPTGVGYYTLNLFRALFARDDGFAYRAFASSAQPAPPTLEELCAGIGGCRTVRWPTRLKQALWTRLESPPLERFTGPIDIAHGAFHLLPPSRRARRLVTVFDLTGLTRPETHTGASNRVHLRLLRHATKNADGIIAISQSCKRDLVEFFGVPEDRIDVVYGGVYLDEFEGPLDEETWRAVMRRLGIVRDYFIHLGTLEPRKNIPRLLRAYARLKDRLDEPPQLVLAGKPGWKYEDIFESIAGMKLERDVVHTGYLDRRDAVLLLKGAFACVYPSLYEGFGLPVLEAMAAGTPVLTSNVSSLPEVAGDAGLLVDPEDEEQIEAGLAALVEDREGALERAHAGKDRARLFTWEKSAETLAGVYRKISSEE